MRYPPGQIDVGDLVTIGYSTETAKMTFVKESRRALVRDGANPIWKRNGCQ